MANSGGLVRLGQRGLGRFGDRIEPAGSAMAISLSILRLRSMLAALRPAINWL
jgi:hypothetical protein